MWVVTREDWPRLPSITRYTLRRFNSINNGATVLANGAIKWISGMEGKRTFHKTEAAAEREAKKVVGECMRAICELYDEWQHANSHGVRSKSVPSG